MTAKKPAPLCGNSKSIRKSIQDRMLWSQTASPSHLSEDILNIHSHHYHNDESLRFFLLFQTMIKSDVLPSHPHHLRD